MMGRARTSSPKEAGKVKKATSRTPNEERAMNEALDRHEDFDISVDDGREITGYKRIIRISDK